MKVRYTFAVAAAALLFASSLSAQSPSARIGAMAGANIATVAGDDVENPSSLTGLLAGASLVKPLSGALALSIDALYSMKGAKEKTTDGDFTVTLKYVEVPIQLRLGMGSGAAKPFVSAGASLAFKAGCTVDATVGGTSVSVDCADTEGEGGDGLKVKSFDAGAVVGGGVDFAAGRNTLTVGARYTMGLTDIAESTKARNRVISVYAGISMPFGR